MKTKLVGAGVLAAAITTVPGLGLGGDAAAAATLCVGDGAGCSRTLQAALDRSRDGDTIRVGRGRFRAGATVRHSVRIVGAGPRATALVGGGPVLTIGVPGAAHEPTVSIRSLTISGGVAHGDGVRAFGGGVFVPSGANGAPGATVRITDAVIAGNRAVPTRVSPSPSGVECPGGRDCPFALALGGGISTTGDLTLRHVVVRDNVAAGVASDADGGGVASLGGQLVLSHVSILRNRAVAGVPNGRFAEGGGVFANEGGSVQITSSRIAGNVTSLTSRLPYHLPDGKTIDMSSHGGGVHVGDDMPTSIVRTAITGNTSTVRNLEGQGLAFDAGILVNASPLVLRDSVVARNHVGGIVQTTADVGPIGTAIEVDGGGTIERTRIVDNTVSVVSPAGVAAATSGLAVYDFTGHPKRLVVRDSVIARNTADARSTRGSATVQGVGLLNNTLLDLRAVRVSGNRGTASAPAGFLQGGGIWNGPLLSGPPVELALVDSVVSGNRLSGSHGLEVRGGGIFTTVPFTSTRTRVAGNAPDDCSGC